ncbi:MAG: hypothetical protein DRP87_03450 [Spirochaetes bacterium]|nr:MAG: hypothetical protein DRP87_03450 [Spirochaetota bacterium]
MEGSIEIFVLIILASVIGFLLFMLLKARRIESSSRKMSPSPGSTKPCPLCGTGLVKNKEQVKSMVYPGKPDKIMHIFGCPYCYPANSEIKRICPVCKKPLKPEGFVIARVYEKRPRTHIHVIGCTECKKGLR